MRLSLLDFVIPDISGISVPVAIRAGFGTAGEAGFFRSGRSAQGGVQR
jgi:hypothetical protein